MEPIDLPAVEYAERSDPGRDPSKQVNEDACGRRETRLGHLCVVCDGMGGHAAGREAAELALATIFETFEQAPEDAAPATVLRAAIEEASRRVHAMPTSEVALGRPGSTVVAVLMHAQGTEVAHVGDSRAYLVHEGQIFRVTRDHSIVQEMVDRGLLTLQQAAHHPDANRITRALGMAPEVEADAAAAAAGARHGRRVRPLLGRPERPGRGRARSSTPSAACPPRRPPGSSSTSRTRAAATTTSPSSSCGRATSAIAPVGGRRADDRADAGDPGADARFPRRRRPRRP